ncbi:MAG TPA: ribonuclease H-like YkuK family protein [Saprospiraceae bacterium]|nr:ribonuclease H-like YkuK family protein [Saprospiraceae bacterium]
MAWRRFNGERIEEDILIAVRSTVEKEIAHGFRLKVCIGTDSMVRGPIVEYATVIVFLREKKGGFMFIYNERSEKQVSLRERMITEVWKSVDVAYKLCDLLDEFDIELEVHADINTDPHFKSNEALREAMGYILGMGFVFKAKPDAFASSYCADKVV